MNEQNQVSFKDINDNYRLLKNNIKNENIKFLYSKFNFKYFDQIHEDKSKQYLHDFLKQYKFITYELVALNQNEIKESKKIINSVLCIENYCLIIDSMDITSLTDILNKENSYVINVNSFDSNIKEEISSFCQYYCDEIKENQFVNLTIKSISAYIIRRYFLPSYFFKDKSFFTFKCKQKGTSFLKYNYDEMIKKVKEDKIKENESFQIEDFDQKDFIILRKINSNEKSLFYLVIHIESFYVFMMKKIDCNENIYEVDFNQKYSSRYITRFYGFLKEKEKRIGFIYEFMSNGTLYDYIMNNKENVNDSFSYITMIRIAQGINFLHSNSMIHRDIKPQNILIDHDYMPYLSDFDHIKNIAVITKEMTSNIGYTKYVSPEQYSSHNYSYPTDIYTFGQMIYFIFEKKDLLENVNDLNFINEVKNLKIPDENNLPQSIKNLCQKCISFDPKDRPVINDVIKYLQEDANSFLELSFLKENFDKITKDETKQFFKEVYYLLFISPALSDEHLQQNKIQLYKVLNLINSKSDISNLLFEIGKIYYDENDYDKAKEYFEVAAQMSNSDAICFLGKLHIFGKGVIQDYKKAKEYLELSAKQNNTDALNNLGNIYKYGLGVDVDYKKAKHYYQLASNLGNMLASCNLGIIYLGGFGIEPNYSEAIKYFELAAKQNIPDAFNILGLIYLNGIGVDQDYQKSRYFYEKAAELGFPASFLNLGEIYLYGKGVDKDYTKAKNYFELATKHNFDDAQYYLGIIYKNGLNIAKDYAKAKMYFEKASDNNFSLATYQLGKLFYHGYGIKQDFNQAKELFERAAKQKYEKALYQLGMMYKNGQGVEQNFKNAIKYFEAAALQNNSKAIYQIGIMYFNGLVENYDYKRAIEYFEMSSQKNNPNSMFFLGLIYEMGLGVDRDISKAIQYHTQCSTNKYCKYISKSNDMILSIEEKIIYNKYYYCSNNNLGLIFLIEKEYENFELANKYIKEAGLNEYPIGQNSLGLLKQFYFNELDDAKYFYKKASKYNFSLSEFNLAHIYEEKGKIDKSLKYYKDASDHASEKIIFRNLLINDERLKISKEFIMIYTNLKLSQYYLSQKQSQNQFINFYLEAIFRPLFSLILQTKFNSYFFNFEAIKINGKYIITNLKQFFLDNPLFTFKKQTSLNSENLSSIGWKIININPNDKIEFKLTIHNNFQKNNSNNNICTKKDNDNKKEATDLRDDDISLNFHFQNEIKKVFDSLMNKNDHEIIMDECLSNDDIEIRFNNNRIIRYLKYSKDLYEILLNTLEEKNIIDDILDEMKVLLYTKPYPILFGRIQIYPKNHETVHNINGDFYEGMGNEL